LRSTTKAFRVLLEIGPREKEHPQPAIAGARCALSPFVDPESRDTDHGVVLASRLFPALAEPTEASRGAPTSPTCDTLLPRRREPSSSLRPRSFLRRTVQSRDHDPRPSSSMRSSIEPA